MHLSLAWRRFAAIFVVSVALLPFETRVAMAQSIFGTFVGTVTDASGAVVPGAAVSLTHKRTQISRSVTTGAEGSYQAANLAPGPYLITVTLAGFNAESKDAELLARETVRVDARLQVATASEAVEVTARNVITTDSPTIADSKSGREINSLALNFRATNQTSPIVVATLAPAVQQDRSGNISIAGSMPYATSVSIDGISTDSVRFNGPVRDLFPSVESIEEFKVTSASNNAEFAQVTDITTTSKSGGNELHGTAYWFLQRTGLNSTDGFAPPDPDNPGKRLKPTVKADSYGAALGGPIVKNKTFFFFGSFEAVRRPNDLALSQLVPPDAFRNGDLSSVPTAILNPATGQPFPNNQIPINPTSSKILDALYLRQNQPTGASLSGPNFIVKSSGGWPSWS